MEGSWLLVVKVVVLIDSEWGLGVIGIAEPGPYFLSWVNNVTVNKFWISVRGLSDEGSYMFDTLFEYVD